MLCRDRPAKVVGGRRNQARHPGLRGVVRWPNPNRIPFSDPAELDRLYSPPSAMIQKAVTRELMDFHRAYPRAASFFCLATGSDKGLDSTPRGGPPGFVRVLDERTVAFADWPGNNRIESLRNLLEDDRAALLFLFAGLDVFCASMVARASPRSQHFCRFGRGAAPAQIVRSSSRWRRCCFTAARPSTAPSFGILRAGSIERHCRASGRSWPPSQN